MKIDEATPAQREAIETNHRLIVVLAGPGSGKTATTVARIKRLIASGVPHERIAAITFTNAGAREVDQRLQPEPMDRMSCELAEVLAGPEGVKRMNQGPRLGYSGTLHGFCLRMLKEHGSLLGYGSRLSIVSPESAEALLVSKASMLGCKLGTKDLLTLKAKGRPARGARLTVAETVIATYYDDLREAGIVDFDILLTETANLLADKNAAAAIGAQFDYLFVDECQDSAAIDFTIYAGLRIPNKFFVGDPDQSIYGFRGAWLEGIMALARNQYAKVIRLEDNFRSHSEICDAANRLIAGNRNRIEKETRSAKGPGGTVNLYGFPPLSVTFQNEGEEIGYVARVVKTMLEGDRDNEPMLPAPSIAVLGRTNSIVHGFATTLAACGVPVAAREKSDLPRDWSYARALAELLVNPDNDTLAEFFMTATFEKKGASPRDAREAAHAARTAANAVGKNLNQANLGFQRRNTPSDFLQMLAHEKVSLESRALVAERMKDLPRDVSMLEFAMQLAATRDNSRDPSGDGVQCLTIHGAKGREFDVVFLVGFEDEITPGRAQRIEELEEERRLAYVAVTRARKMLFVTWAQSRATPWGAIKAQSPSRFLRELAGDI